MSVLRRGTAPFASPTLVGMLVLTGCATPQPKEGVLATPQRQEADPSLAKEEGTLSLERKAIQRFALNEVPTYEWTRSLEGIEFLEAAFRFQLADKRNAIDAADFVFLGINVPDGIVDPPEALMSRFKDLPNVEAVSRGDITSRRVVRHRDLGGRGVVLVIKNLRVVDDSTIEVVLEYQRGCIEQNPYRFEYRDGKWVMVGHGGWSWISKAKQSTLPLCVGPPVVLLFA